MGQDRRHGIDRRITRNRRKGADVREYFGPERRYESDRRNYSERRKEKYTFSEKSALF